MINFCEGSHTSQLVALLAVVGEYPLQSVHLIGNTRVLKVLINKLIVPQTIRNAQTKTKLVCRLLTISGKGHGKTVRFYRSALDLLDWIGAKNYYLRSFWNHRFPGDQAHMERNHRVAEATAMCMKANIEFRPFCLPLLQNIKIKHIIPNKPIFYPSKILKQFGELELNKTIFTRMVGALFVHGNCYAVYNTRNTAMKWSGMGEFKAMHALIEVSRLNAGISSIDSAILFAESENLALTTLLEAEENRRKEFRFDAIYHHTYFIPLNACGIRQLAIFTVPNWKEKLLSLLFASDMRSYEQGLFEYDAYINGTYILSHLDGDICRIMRFRDAIKNQQGRFEVLCYEHQVPFVKSYLGQGIDIKIIDMGLVEAGLGIKGRCDFEN